MVGLEGYFNKNNIGDKVELHSPEKSVTGYILGVAIQQVALTPERSCEGVPMKIKNCVLPNVTDARVYTLKEYQSAEVVKSYNNPIQKKK